MNIYFTDQTQQLSKHLQRFCNAPVMDYDKKLLKDNETTIEINTLKKFEEIDLDFLFDYKIFPDNIMTSLTLWANEKRSMKIGDTIVQQVFIPPIRSFSQKIIFGVRINAKIDEPNRKGYSYETLAGHVEKGQSAFTIEKQDNGKIEFAIKTFSEPGTLLTKLLGPVFSVPYQSYCTKQALRNVKKQIELQG
jgi:hypothetical protein